MPNLGALADLFRNMRVGIRAALIGAFAVIVAAIITGVFSICSGKQQIVVVVSTPTTATPIPTATPTLAPTPSSTPAPTAIPTAAQDLPPFTASPTPTASPIQSSMAISTTAYDRIYAAVGLWRSGQKDEAVEVLLSLTKDPDADSNERKNAAETLLAWGRKEEAAEAFRSLLPQDSAGSSLIKAVFELDAISTIRALLTIKTQSGNHMLETSISPGVHETISLPPGDYTWEARAPMPSFLQTCVGYDLSHSGDIAAKLGENIVVEIPFMGNYPIPDCTSTIPTPPPPLIDLSGQYTGTAYNETAGIEFLISLDFIQNGDVITGNLSISLPAFPSVSLGGAVDGILEGNELHFLRSSIAAEVDYWGTVQPDGHIEGTFHVPSTGERGTWAATKEK